MKPRMSGRLSATPSTLVGWPLTIIRALDAQGVDGRRLAVEAGIDPTRLEDPEARVPSVTVARLFQLAADVTANPAFGLTVAKFAQPTTFFALGYAMLASRTLKEALERLVRYRRVIGDLLEFRLEESRDRYRVVITFAGPVLFPHVAVEAGAAALVRTTRLLRGTRDFNPTSVELERLLPNDCEPYRRFFRAPIAFGQPLTALEFVRSDIEALLPSGHAKLAQQNDELIVRHLAGLQAANVSNRVQQALLDTLASGSPTKPGVAFHLGMSPRKLQRCLSAEGSSFKRLVQEARLILAEGYLSEGRLSVKEIAFLLGFSGASAFSRAFKRWTGRAPTEPAARPTLSQGT